MVFRDLGRGQGLKPKSRRAPLNDPRSHHAIVAHSRLASATIADSLKEEGIRCFLWRCSRSHDKSFHRRTSKYPIYRSISWSTILAGSLI